MTKNAGSVHGTIGKALQQIKANIVQICNVKNAVNSTLCVS